jgi:hypothetical protein
MVAVSIEFGAQIVFVREMKFTKFTVGNQKSTTSEQAPRYECPDFILKPKQA